ncbi:hypothetical protein V6N11_082751 [Hibiscus sabdariffa]|uniref:Uncharacterized protein n=1 Tax=Hibiscus sabdariffa TaxID=183260 RepID=A0ABR2QJU0_9ROSI
MVGNNASQDGMANGTLSRSWLIVGIMVVESNVPAPAEVKKKPAPRAVLVPKIISLVEGEVTEVVPHVVKQQPDKHVAVTLLDTSTRKVGLVGGKVAKQRGLAGRNSSDARHGLPLRKSTEFRLSNANNMSIWVQDLAQQLSAAKNVESSDHGFPGIEPELLVQAGSISVSGITSSLDTRQVPADMSGIRDVRAVMEQ